MVLALGLLAGLVWYAVAQPPSLARALESEQVRETLQGAKTASVTVGMAAGGLTIHSGASGDTLVEGEVGRLTDRGVNHTTMWITVTLCWIFLSLARR